MIRTATCYVINWDEPGQTYSGTGDPCADAMRLTSANDGVTTTTYQYNGTE